MIELWYAAHRASLGIIVHTEGNAERVRQKLYAERKKLADPDLAGIAICISPTNPNDLWLVKKERNSAS